MSAAFSFVEGGYLIIDEIENHFNREIVATLIRFFMDEKVIRMVQRFYSRLITQNY